jgi:regulatory protein YycH of two-component signal transduction system YycFG
MDMNLEKFKTILLINLVIISIFLTWNLWTYQTDLETVTDEKAGEVLKEKKKSEVIRPYQIAYHTKGKHYASELRTYIDPLTNALGESGIKGIEDQGKVNSVNSYISEHEKIELVYPVEIPMEIIAEIYKIEMDKALNDVMIDRIVINPDNRQIYFISYKESRVVKGTLSSVDENVFKTVQTSFPSDVGEHVKYSLPSDLNNPKFVYLPIKEPQVDKIFVKAQEIKTSSFVPVLFGDGSYTEVKEDTFFISGTNMLEIDRKQKQLNFKNTANTKETEKLSNSARIQRSIAFITGHNGWKDDSYFLEDWNVTSEETTTTFRLFINNASFPVFPNARIQHEFKNGNTSLYKRPTYDLLGEEVLVKEPLISGTKVIELLENDKSIEMNRVQDIRIGYKIEPAQESKDFILKPIWAVKYEGESEYGEIRKGGGIEWIGAK